MGHTNQQFLSHYVIAVDQVCQFVRSHANVENQLLVILEGSLNMLEFPLGQIRAMRLVDKKAKLRVIELMSHIQVPIWFRRHPRNKPIGILHLLRLRIITMLFLRQRPQEVRSKEMRHEFIIREIIRQHLSLWEDGWLRHALKVTWLVLLI